MGEGAAKKVRQRRARQLRPPDFPTVHQQACADLVHELVVSNDEYAAGLALCAVRMATGFFDEELQAAIIQKHVAGFDLYDAQSFLEILNAIHKGKIATVRIGVDAEPGSDADVAGNNAKLSDLPAPFRAEFWGGNTDHDGNLHWDAAIRMGRANLDGTREQIERGPGTAPLEVGYCLGSQTYERLRFCRSVARWAYGSKDIWLMVVCDDELWSLGHLVKPL